MKKHQTRFNRPRLLIFTVVFGLSILISSCKKDDQTSATASANVMIVNSVEGSSPQDFYLDDAKVNSSTVAYTQTNGYFTVTSGNHKADFKTSNSAAVSSTSNVSFQPNKYYTIYYSGNASAASNTTIEDDLTAPTAGMAKVRFVHLSSVAAATVDFGVTGGAKLVSALAYKAASAYYSVTPLTSFQLFAAGSTTAALNLTGLTLQAGKIYTIYISGASTTTLSYRAIANN